MKKGLGALTVLLLILTASCAKKHWVPDARQLKVAEAVAKLHALQTLSDQAGAPDVMALTFSPDGPAVEYPLVFTFHYTPYSRYRLKFWGDREKGVKRIHVLYFNPAEIPDWEKPEVMTGDFPAHFSVLVDMDALRAIESDPPERPAFTP